MKLRTGDTVVVISGKDKGKTGTILRILTDSGRLVVSGIAMRTKHVKKTQNQAGQIVRYEGSLHASNVMLLDPKTKRRTRVKFAVDEKTGKKTRIATRSGEVITGKTAAKAVTKKAGKSDKAKTKEADTKAGEAETAGSAEKEAPKVPGRKPFWSRMGFGSAVSGEEPDNHSQRNPKDHSVPSEQTHVHSGQRGS
jgi:large subunit ribosomal protein L24